MKFQTVKVFVPFERAIDAKNIITSRRHNGAEDLYTYVDFFDRYKLFVIVCDMVPYGQTDFEDMLVEMGIAYTLHTCDSTDPNHRCKHLRFNAEGNIKQIAYSYPSLFVPVDYIEQCLSKYEEKPTAIYNTMKTIAKNIRKITNLLPWDNQVKYGQRYRAKRIISNV